MNLIDSSHGPIFKIKFVKIQQLETFLLMHVVQQSL